MAANQDQNIDEIILGYQLSNHLAVISGLFCESYAQGRRKA